MELKDVETLIKPLLNDGRKLVSCETKKLLAAGENYGSTMLAVTIKLINTNCEEEIFNCVAKMPPPNELMWTIFNTPETFKQEISVYTIVPTLNKFGKRFGLEELLPFFPKCLGARISLDPLSNSVDKNACLLLENVKILGYKICDRFIGFNKETTELLLTDFATLHATPIAFKHHNPQEFEDVIRPILKSKHRYHLTEDRGKKLFVFTKNAASRFADCLPILPNVEKAFGDFQAKLNQKHYGPIRQPFATLLHNDFWVNNMMVKFENSKPISSMLLDFQVIDYNSCAGDIIFFLFTSVELSVLRPNFDYFVKFYLKKFTETLERLRCPNDKFKYETFCDDLEYYAKGFEIIHILFMLCPIFMKKGEAKDLDNIKDDDDVWPTEEQLDEHYFDRLAFVLMEFNKRGTYHVFPAHDVLSDRQ